MIKLIGRLLDILFYCHSGHVIKEKKKRIRKELSTQIIKVDSIESFHQVLNSSANLAFDNIRTIASHQRGNIFYRQKPVLELTY